MEVVCPACWEVLRILGERFTPEPKFTKNGICFRLHKEA